MFRNAAPLDGDALLRALNPFTKRPSLESVDAALQRFLAESELSSGAVRGRSGFPRARLAFAGGLLVASAAAAFAAINLLPASSPSAGVANAWAKNVIAHSAAVAAGSGDGVLHLDMLLTQTNANPSGKSVSRVQSWAQLSDPYDFWETTYSGSDVSSETTVLGDQVDVYNAATNTLSGGTKRIVGAQRAALFNPAYQAVLAVLYPQNAIGTSASAGQPKVGDSPLPPTPRPFAAYRPFSQLIVRLIRSPNVTVDRKAAVDGQSAIKITCLRGQAILYVQPHTYAPLELVTAGDPGAASIPMITTRFDAYETLPHGSVSPPNLRQLHPGANVTP